MKAAIVTQYGSADHVVVEERPMPTPLKGEVLVKVHYSTVQTADWRVRSLTLPGGMKMIARFIFGWSKPRQPILGTEYSGEVIAVGPDVNQFKAGDAIMGTSGASFGAHAQYIKVSVKGLAMRKPDSITFKEAAALPFGALTALDYLKYKAKVQSQDRVLIYGASGAVGVAAIQICKHLGAHVTAVCSERNFDLVKELGADAVVDYRTTNFWEQGHQYDVIFDCVGGLKISNLRHTTRPSGKILLISASLWEMLYGALWNVFSSQKVLSGVTNESPQNLQELLDLHERGQYRVILDRSFPLEQIADAHRHVESRHKRGNVVIEIGLDS